MIVFKIFLDCINFSKKDWNMLHVVWESSHVRNRLNYSIWRQSITYCLHCSSWLNTGSFPDATASCNGVLKTTEDKAEAPPLQSSQVHKPRPPFDLPALAVLHVGVGSGLEQSLCDLCHAAHHFRRVFLGAEGTDQVKWGFHCPHCGCVHLSRVANQEDGGKFITWEKRREDSKSWKKICCHASTSTSSALKYSK